MNRVKKYLGIVWILIGLVAGYYLVVSQAIPKFLSGQPEDKIPAFIYVVILTPLIVGSFLIFGIYALRGEYDQQD